MSIVKRILALLALAGMFVPTLALAHPVYGEMGGALLAGVLHPWSGLDHIAAMVAVGLWGAQTGKRALWVLPMTFPLAMVLGAALGIAGMTVPAIEPGIALSVVALGLLIALALRPPLWSAVTLVGAFAVFHGYAHGSELPAQVSAISYAAGFVLGTLALHLIGISLGVASRNAANDVALRTGGVAIAVCGACFAFPQLIAI